MNVPSGVEVGQHKKLEGQHSLHFELSARGSDLRVASKAYAETYGELLQGQLRESDDCWASTNFHDLLLEAATELLQRSSSSRGCADV